MLTKLRSLIEKSSGAPEAELNYFMSKIYSAQLSKGEFLFRQGEKSDVIAMVASGFLYSFYTSSDDNQKVKKFSWEGRISSPYSTLISGDSVCYFSAEALEDSKLVCLKFSELTKMYERHPCWQKLGRIFAEQSLVERELREYETLCLPLIERYENFVKAHKDVIDRIPQYLIASYLGVNAVSLSRLRSRRTKK